MNTTAKSLALLTGSVAATVTVERVFYDADGARHVETLSEDRYSREES